MKATRLHAYGDIDQFKYEDVPDPAPGAGETLVEVKAASLNPVEIYIRRGLMAQMVPLELPAILGLDLAGIVTAVGANTTEFKFDDRVIGKLPIQGRGSDAQRTVAAPKYLARLADNVSFVDGATLPLAGLAGRQAVDAAGIKAGDRVLVTGALGAVGRAAVQYLQELGAVPVAGVRAARVGEAKALGIDALAIDEPGANASFDAAISLVGGPVAATAIEWVRDGGVLVAVAGVPEGANADGRIRIVNVVATEDAVTLQKIADAAASGKLSIPAAKTLPLAQVGEGHRLLEAGHVGGKIVFVP
jgi:NADPH:quinone reductase-like Zn-dependent oxidoreductase